MPNYEQNVLSGIDVRNFDIRVCVLKDPENLIGECLADGVLVLPWKEGLQHIIK